jgi:hypothetical protein
LTEKEEFRKLSEYGNSLCSYLKQNCHFFFIYKIGEQEGRTDTAWVDWYQWKREEVRKW